jgi:hypothetical protein
MATPTFTRFAGLSGLLAAALGLLYAVAFVIISQSAPALGGLLSALCLLLGGLCSLPLLLVLFDRLAASEPGFAALGRCLALAGAFGSIIHGGYDLANSLNPPATLPTALANLPNPVDPRGLLTFGATGLGLAVIAWLGERAGLPPGQRWLTWLLCLFLLTLYLGRLIVLTPTSPLLLVPAVLTGFVVNPLWLAWTGWLLLRRAPRPHPVLLPDRA